MVPLSVQAHGGLPEGDNSKASTNLSYITSGRQNTKAISDFIFSFMPSVYLGNSLSALM